MRCFGRWRRHATASRRSGAAGSGDRGVVTEAAGQRAGGGGDLEPAGTSRSVLRKNFSAVAGEDEAGVSQLDGT